MNIVYIFSNNWLPYVAVQLAGLAEHNAMPLRIFLVCDGLAPWERDFLDHVLENRAAEQTVTIEVINAYAVYQARVKSDINVTPSFTRFTLYRLLLPSLLPASVDKVLYLDADTLVCGSLERLYANDLKGRLVAAVVDEGAIERKRQLGFEETEGYFNAGVLLLNLAEIRAADLESRWLRMVNETQYIWPDQDILNITCKGAISWLPAEFNRFGAESPHSKDTIIHYIVQKPWRNHTVPRYADWQKARNEYDNRFLRIPKILHVIEIEGVFQHARVLENRERNMSLLDDFELHIHCLSKNRIRENNSWSETFRGKRFDELRHDAARQFIKRNGGVFLDDRIVLSQALDPLLRFDNFHFAVSGKSSLCCFGGIAAASRTAPEETYEPTEAECQRYAPNWVRLPLAWRISQFFRL